ncbi:MAG: FAD-dependent oxidoreductase [archaeon YNP-LCB-024-027]|nr:FAD-dependent oxidoreductase [Candidatus Culexarchaeum yellowstonense]
MQKNIFSTIILGAGLSGLSYAYANVQKGDSIIILEKNDRIGGLMKNFDFNGFLFDFGPHIFRSKDRIILNFVKELLCGNYHSVSSNPCIFRGGIFFDNVIPVITYGNIEKLPEGVRERVKRDLENSNRVLSLDNFESCIVSQVGETLYWEFFGEYSRKWWGVDPKNLSSDIAPKNLVIGGEKSYGHITTNFERPSEEIYPRRGGIFEIVRRLKEKVEALGGSILTNSNVVRLECDGDEISRVIVERNGEEIEMETRGKLVVSTIPLTVLCRMLGIENDLIYRGDICIFIKLKGDRMFNYSWIYFHDSDIIFGRIYEPLYYSEYNSPNGYTSLCVEVTSFENDINWRDRYLGDKVIEQLIDLNIVKKNQEPEVLGLEKYAYAYPVYTVGYKKELERVFSKLNSFKNLKVIGRTGSFSYLNMWECLRWAVY